MKGFKKSIERLSYFVQQLEEGELDIEDLTELEITAREVYEKSVILKYKAFEDYIDLSEKRQEKLEKEGGENEIDFSMFDAVEEEKEVPIFEPFADTIEKVIEEEQAESVVEKVEATIENVVEEVVEEVKEIVEEVKEKITPAVKKENTVVENPNPGTENQFQDNSIAAQFSGSKLDTLIGAFGINQRLGFINNLFDGSSDNFSTAIKELDSKPTLDEANILLNELSSKYEWEMEDEDVVEFQSYVNRRYA